MCSILYVKLDETCHHRIETSGNGRYPQLRVILSSQCLTWFASFSPSAMTLWSFAVFIRQNPVNPPKKIEVHSKVRKPQIDQCFDHPNLRSEIWSINRHGKCPPTEIVNRLAGSDLLVKEGPWWWSWWRSYWNWNDGINLQYLQSSIHFVGCYFQVVFKEAATYIFFKQSNSLRRLAEGMPQCSCCGCWETPIKRCRFFMFLGPLKQIALKGYWAIVWSSPVKVDRVVTFMGNYAKSISQQSVPGWCHVMSSQKAVIFDRFPVISMMFKVSNFF